MAQVRTDWDAFSCHIPLAWQEKGGQRRDTYTGDGETLRVGVCPVDEIRAAPQHDDRHDDLHYAQDHHPRRGCDDDVGEARARGDRRLGGGGVRRRRCLRDGLLVLLLHSSKTEDSRFFTCFRREIVASVCKSENAGTKRQKSGESERRSPRVRPIPFCSQLPRPFPSSHTHHSPHPSLDEHRPCSQDGVSSYRKAAGCPRHRGGSCPMASGFAKPIS